MHLMDQKLKPIVTHCKMNEANCYRNCSLIGRPEKMRRGLLCTAFVNVFVLIASSLAIMCQSLKRPFAIAVSFIVISQIIPSTIAQISAGLLDSASSITASSTHHEKQCQSEDAKYSNTAGCWCSNYDKKCNNGDVYLQINLGGTYKITKVGVKSCKWKEYITSYKLKYYYNSWTWYNNQESLTGNNGCCSEISTDLNPIIIATQIRLYPLSASGWCSTNLELYGYPWTPTQSPTSAPTPAPTPNPTNKPTSNPTAKPTDKPTSNPTNNPTDKPTKNPTNNPTVTPTHGPTTHPSTPGPTLVIYADVPTNRPTYNERIVTNSEITETESDHQQASDSTTGGIAIDLEIILITSGVLLVICCICVIFCFWYRKEKVWKEMRLMSNAHLGKPLMSNEAVPNKNGVQMQQLGNPYHTGNLLAVDAQNLREWTMSSKDSWDIGQNGLNSQYKTTLSVPFAPERSHGESISVDDLELVKSIDNDYQTVNGETRGNGELLVTEEQLNDEGVPNNDEAEISVLTPGDEFEKADEEIEVSASYTKDTHGFIE
eukprot:255779_1